MRARRAGEKGIVYIEPDQDELDRRREKRTMSYDERHQTAPISLNTMYDHLKKGPCKQTGFKPKVIVYETSSEEDEGQVHVPRKSQFPVRMSLQTSSKNDKNTTEIITSNISLQEALARKSKKKQIYDEKNESGECFAPICAHVSRRHVHSAISWCEALSAVEPKCEKSRPQVAGFNFELNH